MKLHKTHIFLILLLSLMFCCIGFRTLEGLTGSDDTKKASAPLANRIDPNLAKGSGADPFNNAPSNPIPNTQQASYSDLVQSAVPASKMKAIPKSQIPSGDEDLYILKSEIVPPVCPKCPDTAACPRSKPCPPCPPCARCPEPSFRCKKVPNYRSNDQSELPMPMLNTFAAFR